MTVNAPMPASLAGATGTVTIDLRQIAANYKALAAKVAPAVCAAVVKADAYGLGLERVMRTLARAGCTTFFIATPAEAEAARRTVPEAVIYALDGLIGHSGAAFARLGVRPVLSTLDDIATWSALCETRQQALKAALHIDTGLNRLGLPASDTRRLANEPSRKGKIYFELVMSHLACADNADDAKNRDQLVAFLTLSALFPKVPRSLSASDGLMLGNDFHFDLVRPGYALYGGQASQSAAAPVKPAVTVAARILSVVAVAIGETVGYSATWSAKRQSRIATIAAGYADGIPRNASATNDHTGGHVLINGAKAPIVGRVSMDLVTVDVTDLPERAVLPGDFATLIGNGLSIEDAGIAAGTIGYEILTRLGPRFERLYLDDEGDR